MREHLDLLYRASVEPAEGYRWRFRGARPPQHLFAESLSQGTLCHYVIVGRESRAPEGYVALYNPQLSDGYAYAGFQRLERGVRTPALMYEGLYLLLDHGFRAFALRRVYFDIPGFNLDQFQSAVDAFLAVEGRLTGRDYFDGRYWDATIAMLDRERWEGLRERLRPLVAG